MKQLITIHTVRNNVPTLHNGLPLLSSNIMLWTGIKMWLQIMVQLCIWYNTPRFTSTTSLLIVGLILGVYKHGHHSHLTSVSTWLLLAFGQYKYVGAPTDYTDRRLNCWQIMQAVDNIRNHSEPVLNPTWSLCKVQHRVSRMKALNRASFVYRITYYRCILRLQFDQLCLWLPFISLWFPTLE